MTWETGQPSGMLGDTSRGVKLETQSEARTREPWRLALYSQSDAARYTSVPLSTVHRWFAKGHSASRERLASFDDLISLLFVRELRRRRITLRDITAAADDLRERTGLEYPFVYETLWVAGRDVLVRMPDEPDSFLSPNRRGQLTLPDVTLPERVELPNLLEGIRGELTYAFGRVAAWRPADRITARPQVQFGLTCIEGTRLPTRDLFDSYQEGDSIQALAQLFAVTETDVHRAVEWEQSLAA